MAEKGHSIHFQTGDCIYSPTPLRRGQSLRKNAPEVRKVLETKKNVLGVFSGHHHGGGYKQINDIHYYTLKAMVEGSGEGNNSYVIDDVQADSRMTVTGYRKATSMKVEA